MIPFAFLSVLALLMGRRLAPQRLACASVRGLAGILAYMARAHVSIWYPLYPSQHIASTEAIAFLFIPFDRIPGLAAGLLLGWIVSLIPGIRAR
ncbi:MAG TPA: hypothetical protein VE758_06785 [Chthoniobacterales bacterium]|nr:hypothetical protein [Chthoniobacterales bacterium]